MGKVLLCYAMPWAIYMQRGTELGSAGDGGLRAYEESEHGTC